MLRKTMLLAAALAALAGLAAPAANAETKSITLNGAQIAAPVHAHAVGTTSFTSSAGGFACPTTATLDLGLTTSPTSFDSSTGTVTGFEPAPGKTGECTYSGGLDNLCGVVDAHQSTGLPWTLHATKYPSGQYGIRVTGVHFDIGGTGPFCPDVTFSGETILTGNPHNGNNLTIEGTLSSNVAATVHAAGAQTVTPTGGGTLGITT
jgi:hypothetical protein